MSRSNNIIHFFLSRFNRRSFSEMSWIVSGQVITVILNFVIIKILSGMGAENYGIYILVLTISAFLGIIYGPLQQAFIRFYYDYLNQNLIKEYLNSVFGYLKTISIVFLAAVIIFNIFYLFFGSPSEPALFFILAGAYIILLKLSEFFNSALNTIRKRKENAILQGLEKIFIVAGLLIFLYQDYLTLTNAFIVLNLSVLIFLIIKNSAFRKNIPSQKSELLTGEKVKIKKTIINYSIPFLIWAFAAWLQLNGEKWIINGILSTYDVGIYAVMLMIVNGLIAIPNTILTEFVTPIIFKHYSDSTQKENLKAGKNYIKITITAVAVLTIVSTFITYFWGEELIILISSDSYTIYKYLLPLLCLGTGLFYTGQAQTLLGLALNKPEQYIAPKVTTGIVSVIINFLLIKYFGIDGVAYSILLVGIFYIIYISVVNKKIVKILQQV